MNLLTNLYWRLRSKLPLEHVVRQTVHRHLRRLVDRVVTPMEMPRTQRALRSLRMGLNDAKPEEIDLTIRETVTALGHLLPFITEEHLDDLRLLRIAFAFSSEKITRAGRQDPRTEEHARAAANLLASVEVTLRSLR